MNRPINPSTGSAENAGPAAAALRLPTAEEVARLANELFKALPGAPPQASETAPATPPAAPPTGPGASSTATAPAAPPAGPGSLPTATAVPLVAPAPGSSGESLYFLTAAAPNPSSAVPASFGPTGVPTATPLPAFAPSAVPRPPVLPEAPPVSAPLEPDPRPAPGFLAGALGLPGPAIASVPLVSDAFSGGPYFLREAPATPVATPPEPPATPGGAPALPASPAGVASAAPSAIASPTASAAPTAPASGPGAPGTVPTALDLSLPALPSGLGISPRAPAAALSPASVPAGAGSPSATTTAATGKDLNPTALATPGLAGAAVPSPALTGAHAPILPVIEYEFSPALVPDLPEKTSRPFDPHQIRRDFPILEERSASGRPLVWLDNAATTQKPRAVIERLTYFYEHENSNVHRAAHTLAARATDAYESARSKVSRFLNASSAREIIFVRGATEGINLIAQSWGRRNIAQGDEIVISWLEHHSNIVPWQQLCAEKGARLRVAPVDDHGQIILEEYEKLFGPRTRLAAFTQVSNALGTVTPVREMVQIAHRHGALALVDGAQSVPHLRVDVQSLDCDFFIFSGHKVFGPTGIGAVYGKSQVLEHMPPWQGGGNMIADVTFEKTVYHPPPMRFEAGTGNIADAAGLGAALDYVESLGLENICRYEHELLVYGTERLAEVPGLTFVGTAREKASVLSFVLDGVRTEDVGAELDRDGIAVRTGHHCAQPILRRFGLEATVRPSLALYNTREDVDRLAAALHRIQSGRRGPRS